MIDPSPPSPVLLSRRRLVATAGALSLAGPALAAPALDTTYTVPWIGQQKSMSCWAAAAAMLLSWKRPVPPFTDFEAARAAGANYVAAYNSNTGIYGTEFADFAHHLHLSVDAPQNYSAKGYHDLLKAKGPLWVGSKLDGGQPRRHVRVLRGIVGDGTPQGTIAHVLDPDPKSARSYQVTVAQFAVELETIAREDFGAGAPLTPQVIRFP